MNLLIRFGGKYQFGMGDMVWIEGDGRGESEGLCIGGEDLIRCEIKWWCWMDKKRRDVWS